jgi:endoglucanase
VPPGGFANPPGVETGTYGDGDDTDERFWAAAELYRVTGNSEYNDYVRSHFQRSLAGPPSWAYVYPLGLVAYAVSSWGNKDAAIDNQIREDVRGYAGRLVARARSDAYSTVLSREEYYWGSNGVLLDHAFMLLYADYFEPTLVYKEVAAEQIHYLLGRNANDKSYITGVGLNPVQRPFHQYSMAGSMPEPVPGLLSGGPNFAQGNDLAPYPARAYIDDSDAYYVNETAIDMNAVLLFVLAGVATRFQSSP